MAAITSSLIGAAISAGGSIAGGLSAASGTISAVAGLGSIAGQIDQKHQLDKAQYDQRQEIKKQKGIALDKRKTGIDLMRKQLIGSSDKNLNLNPTGARGLKPASSSITGTELG